VIFVKYLDLALSPENKNSAEAMEEAYLDSALEIR